MHERARLSIPLAAPALAILCVVALLGLAVSFGWTQAVDAWLMAHVRGAGGASLRGAVIGLTTLGSAQTLLPLLGCGVVYLLVRREPRRALHLALTVLGGRLAVELAKDLFVRARPPVADMAVAVHSWSFPSAHAANSTITYGALALFAAPPRYRRAVLGLAAVLALAIGASRVWLGVHWPSDVAAGWLFGIGWLMLFKALERTARLPLR